MQTRSANRDFIVNVLVCILMFTLTVGGLIFVIIREGILEERYGKSNLLANANLHEAFMITIVFLVAPFVGGCSAFRFAKSDNRPGKIIGWLLVLIFGLFFLQAAAVEWTRYWNYEVILRK